MSREGTIGRLLCDVWPLQIARPKEKETPIEEPGVRTKLYRNRGKEVKEKEVKPVKLYGKKGDGVNIIGDHGNVFVVEHHLTGERFTVHESEIQIKP